MSAARFSHLTEAWRENRLTPGEATELSALLRSDEAARHTFRLEAELHGLLHGAANGVAVAKASELSSYPGANSAGAENFLGWLRRHGRLGLIATACGVGVGIASASVWSLAHPPALHAQARTVQLAAPEFAGQSGRVLAGFPTRHGIWAGDESEFVIRPDLPAGADTPVLRFIKAEGEGPLGLPAMACDVFQLVDLRPLHAQLRPDQEATLEFSAEFLDAREGARASLRFGCAIMLFTGDPTQLHANWPAAAEEVLSAGRAHLASGDAAPGQWHRLTARCLFTTAADFAVIRLSAAQRAAVPNEFGRQFAGRPTLVLKTQPQLTVRVAKTP
jgi:hypothetical protein